MTVVTVTDDTTREELAETLALLNADAKAMTRRGWTATRGPEYARQHARIDSVLSDYLAVRA